MFLVFTNLVYTGADHLTAAQYYHILRAIPVLVPIIQISLTGSVYTTVAVALERYTTMVEAFCMVSINFVLLGNISRLYFSQLQCVMDGFS